MRLYTRTGDRGETGLIGGQRVPKDDPRVSAYGDVDELNATLGLAAAACPDDAWLERIKQIQDHLFVLGAELSDRRGASSTPAVAARHITLLEGWIDEATAGAPELKQFVLPGGSELAARFHLARTVCRRAERSVVHLAGMEHVGELDVPYLNRLGDLLFAWARLANVRSGVADVPWNAPNVS